MTRRGLTMVELLLALAVTALVGLGTASMLMMVGQASQADREGRSVVMRAHAVQARLRAYLDPALCVLQQDAAKNAVAVWLSDPSAPGMVNLTEVRVLWFDPASKTMWMERVQFPDAWPQSAKDQADVVIPSGTDVVAAVEAQRKLGYTATQDVAGSVWSAAWTFNNPAGQPVTAATRARLALQIGVNQTSAAGVLVACGMANRKTPVQ